MSDKKVSWPIVFWLAAIHVGALTAPFCFSWSAVAACVGMIVATAMAITLGYHRLFTHGSFETYPVIRYAIAFVGTLAGQGGILQWVADHRRHHRFADEPGLDPHTPVDGFWWAHVAWNFFNGPEQDSYYKFFVPDLYRDPVLRFLHRTHVAWHFVTAGVLYAIGGWPFVVWGMFVRMVYVLHITWFVNSASHRWGYRTFKTRDDSTNLWWVGLTAFGEGWHNNHHAFPVSARHGLKWWEFDPTYLVIRAMQWVGLAWDVKLARVNGT
jgi:fatty-acid desaturase